MGTPKIIVRLYCPVCQTAEPQDAESPPSAGTQVTQCSKPVPWLRGYPRGKLIRDWEVTQSLPSVLTEPEWPSDLRRHLGEKKFTDSSLFFAAAMASSSSSSDSSLSLKNKKSTVVKSQYFQQSSWLLDMVDFEPWWHTLDVITLVSCSILQDAQGGLFTVVFVRLRSLGKLEKKTTLRNGDKRWAHHVMKLRERRS